MTQEPSPAFVWSQESISAFWDYWSQFPATYFANQYGDRVAALIASNLRPNCQLLDYGCGEGTLIGHLLNRGFRASGLDLSGLSAQRSSERLSDRPGFEGIHTRAGLAGRTYDAVVLAEVIEHLDEATCRDVLAEIISLLHPGGTFVVTLPNDEDLGRETVFCPCCRHTFHRWQHVRSFDANSLIEVLARAGFTNIRTVETNFAVPGWDRPLARMVAEARFRLGQGRQPHLVAFAQRPF